MLKILGRYTLIQRVLPRPTLLSQCLVHNDRLQSRNAIVFREEPSRHQRQAQSVEIISTQGADWVMTSLQSFDSAFHMEFVNRTHANSLGADGDCFYTACTSQSFDHRFIP